MEKEIKFEFGCYLWIIRIWRPRSWLHLQCSFSRRAGQHQLWRHTYGCWSSNRHVNTSTGQVFIYIWFVIISPIPDTMIAQQYLVALLHRFLRSCTDPFYSEKILCSLHSLLFKICLQKIHKLYINNCCLKHWLLYM